MKERPILFKGPLIQSIFDGRKSQTRRTNKLDRVNARPNDWLNPVFCEATREWVFTAEHGKPEQVRIKCPWGELGNRLWVKETFKYNYSHWTNEGGGEEESLSVSFASGGSRKLFDYPNDFSIPDRDGWVPSIHMPRWASRLTLGITGVRVERLQCISEEDARAEGVAEPRWDVPGASYRAEFEWLWDSPDAMGNWNTPYSWAANPWVWVIKFKNLHHCSECRKPTIEVFYKKLYRCTNRNCEMSRRAKLQEGVCHG